MTSTIVDPLSLLTRPEKEHTTQLRAVSLLLKQHPEYRESPGSHPLKLLLAGSVRDSSDKKRVTQLRQLAKELNIEVSEQRGRSSFELDSSLTRHQFTGRTLWSLRSIFRMQTSRRIFHELR